MARTKVIIDQAGLRAALNSPQAALALKAKAEEIADNVRAMGISVGDRDGGPDEIDLPVEVHVHEGRDLNAVVVLAHPAGLAVQAKHGALTESAARAGLQVRGGQ